MVKSYVSQKRQVTLGQLLGLLTAPSLTRTMCLLWDSQLSTIQRSQSKYGPEAEWPWC
jgi:hypothetical protein